MFSLAERKLRRVCLGSISLKVLLKQCCALYYYINIYLSNEFVNSISRHLEKKWNGNSCTNHRKANQQIFPARNNEHAIHIKYTDAKVCHNWKICNQKPTNQGRKIFFHSVYRYVNYFIYETIEIIYIICFQGCVGHWRGCSWSMLTLYLQTNRIHTPLWKVTILDQ